MTSAIRQLLDELSWEGNARGYRGGGLGRENVLTTEVFQALDFLPRTAFLGSVLAAMHDADADVVRDAEELEDLEVEVLPGDLDVPGGSRVQPDVLLTSPVEYILVEAKRIRRSSFQPEQLAREVAAATHHAAGRRWTVLVVIGAPPPVTVAGRGRLALDEAVAQGWADMAGRAEITQPMPALDGRLTWITWDEIAHAVDTARAGSSYAPTVARSIARMSDGLTDSIRQHR